MKVTYIHHSSFLIELDHAVFLFDYFQGKIPEIDRKKPLFVFVSHRHEDHFSPVIFDLAASHPDITYIISDDIWENRVPEGIYGKVFFMGPGETEDFPCGKEFVRVRTYKSTDEGVAFLVDADGKRIYHAGDLNYWYWEENEKAENNSQKKAYSLRLKEIKAVIEEDGHIPDAAFIPVDSRLKESCYLGLLEYMKEVGAAAVFPMHTFDGGKILQEIKNNAGMRKYLGILHGTGKENESFEI